MQLVSAAPTANAAARYYSQFTFQPQINKVSRALGRSSSVEELHDNSQGRAQKQHILRLKEAAEKQVDCVAYNVLHRI
jgi:hypothetical protein